MGHLRSPVNDTNFLGVSQPRNQWYSYQMDGDFFDSDAFREYAGIAGGDSLLSSEGHKVFGDLTHVSRRILAPKGFNHSFYQAADQPLPGRISLTCEHSGSAKYEITKLEIEPHPSGEPISGQLLRKIQISALLEVATRSHLILYARAQSAVVNTSTSRALDSFDEIRADLKILGPSSDITLEWMSLIYELASIEGDKPTLAVSQAFEISLRTASNWVRAARERGLLDHG